jgi:Putative peptidoglycan binding domain
MNTKLVLFLSCFAAVALTASAVNADPRGGGHGRHFSSMSRGGQTFTRSAPTYSGRNWSGGNYSGRNWSGNNWSGSNWRHHRSSRNQFVFFGDFGYPFFYGYPYYGYGYGYPYGYDYYGGYGYGYGDQGYGYGDQGYGYGDQGYGYGGRNRGGSSVGQLQRRLARAGYYHGAIDGIMGPETRRAIRAYERSHNDREYGMTTDRY